MSIPKIIHYCWFGGKPLTPLAEKCLASWKKFCPDYQIIRWSEENFDVSAAPLYVRQAYEAGRWAFVTDYVRLKALLEMGGVYMDTDVEVVRPLDPYLKHQGFAGFEAADRVQTGLMACQPAFPMFREFLEYYHTASFLRPDGTQDVTTNVETLTRLCRQRGLVFEDRLQVVDGFAVYPREVFCPVDYDTKKLRRTRKTVVIHWFSSSWQTEEERRAREEEKRLMKLDRDSRRRYRIGCAIFGEKGYARLKSLLRRGG